MNVMVATGRQLSEPWRARLTVPNYQVRESARYAGVSTQTVVAWHKVGDNDRTLSKGVGASALSYMQLIELAVVAAFRRADVTLRSIRETRRYVSEILKSEYPFAEYKFKADGKRLVMDLQQVSGKTGEGKLLRADQAGQLAWESILGRLKEFEYEDHHGIVLRWHVAGLSSPIVIDPRIALGAPSVQGTPTWVIRDRWLAGDGAEEIADDFGVDASLVRQALAFEEIDLDTRQGSKWIH